MSRAGKHSSKGLSTASSDFPTVRKNSSSGSIGEQLFTKRGGGYLDTRTTEENEISHLPPLSAKNKTTVLDKLRGRVAVKTELEITPDMASRVVAEYILPMFEADSRRHSDKARDTAFNSKKFDFSDSFRSAKPLSAASGTVYGELKLSQKLSLELQSIQKQLNEKLQRLKDAVQAKESAQSEKEILEIKYHRASTDLRMVKSNFDSALHHKQMLELKFFVVTSQLQKYKELYTSVEAEKKQMASQLHEEKALCDKLKNRATELEHGNSLLKMENDIIGERLKGLYKAYESISSRLCLEDKLGKEVEDMARGMLQVAEYDQNIKSRLAGLIEARDSLQNDCAEMSKLRKEVKESRHKLAVSTKEKIDSLQKDLERTREEREELKEDGIKLEKNYKDLMEEQNKMRQKLKQYRLKRRQYGEAEERICKKCQKMYLESENMKWSCRTHKTEFSGDQYWCCGKTSKESQGCVISKHESKDDDADELEAREKEETERQKWANTKCSSCKEIGHRPIDCPKDPNIRSRKELVDELKRIEDIKEKKKQEAKGLELHEAMMSTFRDGIKYQAFAVGFESSENLEYSSYGSSDSSSQHFVYFDEIMQIKKGMRFDTTENRFRVSELYSKEMDKEMFTSDKSRSHRAQLSFKNSTDLFRHEDDAAPAVKLTHAALEQKRENEERKDEDLSDLHSDPSFQEPKAVPEILAPELGNK